MPSDVVAGHECPQHDELTTGSELTADPLPRFLEEQAYFGGGRPPRTFNFTTAGRSWRLYYRHLGGGGIAFPDSEQKEHFRRLTDVERGEFVEKLRSLADDADRERIQDQRRRQRFHAGMRLAVSPPAGLSKQAPVIHVAQRRGSVPVRPREHRSRSRIRSSARGSPDDDPAPGRAGRPELRVIPPAEFRRQLDAALGGRA
jgi:hypothetical protein